MKCVMAITPFIGVHDILNKSPLGFGVVTNFRCGGEASEIFAIDLTFAGGQNFAAVVEELEQVIPLASPQDGRRYQVLLGFRLTRDQLQFNRR